MKLIKIIPLFLITLLISCSTDSNDELNNDVPEIVDLVSYVADSSFDNTPQGKYVGVIGHYLDRDLHGKIYINMGMDKRHTAIIEMVDGSLHKFKGYNASRSNDKLIQYEGDSGSFMLDFTDFNNPISSNVYVKNVADTGYIVLGKSKAGIAPFVMMGTYVEDPVTGFTGNWDVMTNPLTLQTTPFSFPISDPFPTTVTGSAQTQEINQLMISHVGSTSPLVMTDPNDFDTNTAIGCAPVGVVIPTTEPVLMDINITAPFNLGYIGRGISAGGQTSTINGSVSSWSLNYTPAIVVPPPFATTIPASYSSDSCVETTSGTWSWNGRSGTTTVVD